MAYTAEISRTNPSCFLFLIDQSGSMDDPYGMDTGKRKCDAVSDAINRLLSTLVLRCAKGEDVRDYFQVGVIGYGGAVRSGFSGALVNKQFIPISEVADNPLRVETRIRKEDDGAGGLIERTVRFPIWFEPYANGNTPMTAATPSMTQLCPPLRCEKWPTSQWPVTQTATRTQMPQITKLQPPSRKNSTAHGNCCAIHVRSTKA